MGTTATNRTRIPTCRRSSCAALRTAWTVAIVATSAPDGPDHCSGLPVALYSADDLAQLLEERWHPIAGDSDISPIASCDEAHRTPSCGKQRFTWGTFRRAD